MKEKIKNLFERYQAFWYDLYLEKYYAKEYTNTAMYNDMERKIILHNLEAFRRFALILVPIELLLIFTYDLPMLKSHGPDQQFLYLGYLYSHISIIAVTLVLYISLHIPKLSAYKNINFHHRFVIPMFSLAILASSAYMDALNYYSTKSMILFIVVMFIQLTVFIYSIHFLVFHLLANYLVLYFSFQIYSSLDGGAVNALINISILIVFAFISGYLRARGFVRNELIEKQKQALDMQTKMANAFARFVPIEFINYLNKNSIIEVELGNQVQKQMTVLFSDIRSFTSLSEKMTPQENFNFLNAYLKRIGPTIRSNAGFVDKYIGDALMALFPDSPERAIDTALLMQRAVIDYNLQRKASGYDEIAIGIGIHYGNLMLGTIGEENRMETTVISDVVNLSSRIEGLTKYYNVEILVSDKLFNEIPNMDKYQHRVVDTVIVKGRREPVTVIEILDPATTKNYNMKIETKPRLMKAIKLYREKFIAEGLEIFKQLSNEFQKKDTVFEIYIKRCNKLLATGIPENWNGIERLENK